MLVRVPGLRATTRNEDCESACIRVVHPYRSYQAEVPTQSSYQNMGRQLIQAELPTVPNDIEYRIQYVTKATKRADSREPFNTFLPDCKLHVSIQNPKVRFPMFGHSPPYSVTGTTQHSQY